MRVEVARVWLTDDTIENGVGDGTALVAELTVANGGAEPYHLNPSAVWCLLQVDAGKPNETRLFPPSQNGDGPFGGLPPDGGDLKPIDVPPGQTRSFWVLFRGYRFDGSDIPRRITLTLPDAEGRALELPVADPSRGLLRWNVPPTNSAYMLGVQQSALYGGYVQASVTSTRIERTARAGRFLWDVGLVSSIFVQVQGVLRSSSSSFTGIGVDAHVSAPIFNWGDPTSPIRLGVYAGGETQLLIAMQPPPKQGAMPMAPPTYGEEAPEAGLELDVGARKTALTPFPLSPAGKNPLPHWIARLGYTHAWVGHGTADGYFSSFRLVW